MLFPSEQFGYGTQRVKIILSLITGNPLKLFYQQFKTHVNRNMDEHEQYHDVQHGNFVYILHYDTWQQGLISIYIYGNIVNCQNN